MSYATLVAEAVSAWAMPGQTDTADDFVGSNNGTWSGTAAYTDGPNGRAFSFDGSSDINCGDVYSLPNGSSSVTMFMRARWDSSGSETFVYLGGQSSGFITGYNIKFQDNNDDAGGFVGTNNATTAGTITATTRDVWHDVIVHYDGSEGRAFYRIGDEAEVEAFTATNTTSPTFYIGSRAGVGQGDVDIAEVVVWNRALTDVELAIMRGGPNATEYAGILAGSYINIPCQDDAASTAVAVTKFGDAAVDATASANTSTMTAAGPNSTYPKAINFDGSSDSVEITDGNQRNVWSGESKGSIACWVYREGAGNDQRIFYTTESGSTSSRISVEADGADLEVVIEALDGSAGLSETVSDAIPLNDWVHVLLTWSIPDDRATLYLDGVSQSLSPAWTGSAITSGTSLQAGFGSYRGTSRYFDGRLAGVLAWEDELTASQASLVYTGGATNSLPHKILRLFLAAS